MPTSSIIHIEHAPNSNLSVTSIKPLPQHPLCLSANVNVSGNVTVCFHPSVSVFPLDLEALQKQFHFWNLTLPRFSIKTLKKLITKVKLTVLFKNKAMNLETQKHTKGIKIHQSQITNKPRPFVSQEVRENVKARKRRKRHFCRL